MYVGASYDINTGKKQKSTERKEEIMQKKRKRENKKEAVGIRK